MVDEEVPLRHVLRDLQSVDKAGDQFGVSGRLTKVLELGADAIEVVKVTPQGVSRLNRAVQLHLELLGMIDGIILKRISKGLQSLTARTLLVTTDAPSDDVLGVDVLDGDVNR